jgi:methylglutaconyl-CoA hydratase
MASATDYCFATKFASVKLSELAIGIGPFVVGPPIERKIGSSAFSQLTINATKWHSAEWAREKGLFAEVYESAEEMDIAIQALAEKLVASNPDSMRELKQVMWDGADHWDSLLIERAAMSGKRVLSEFTKKTLEKLKKG